MGSATALAVTDALTGIGILGGFITAIAGAIVAARKLGPEARLTDKQADEIEGRIRVDLLKEIEDLRKGNASIAADLAHAHTELAKATVDANKVQMRNEAFNAAKDRRIAELEHKVEQLEGQVHTLKIKLDMEKGRREDDRPVGEGD